MKLFARSAFVYWDIRETGRKLSLERNVRSLSRQKKRSVSIGGPTISRRWANWRPRAPLHSLDRSPPLRPSPHSSVSRWSLKQDRESSLFDGEEYTEWELISLVEESEESIVCDLSPATVKQALSLSLYLELTRSWEWLCRFSFASVSGDS